MESTICPIHDFEEKTVKHALFLCDYARAVQLSSNLGFLVHDSNRNMDILEGLDLGLGLGLGLDLSCPISFRILDGSAGDCLMPTLN